MHCRGVGLLLAGAVALATAGCSGMGGGMPAGQAQVEVHGVTMEEIETKAEDVFYRYGFDYKGGTGGHMKFEREGGFSDNLLYGNWVSGNVSTRISLLVWQSSPGIFSIRSRSMVVRNIFGGDEDTRLFDLQGTRYRSILQTIASELTTEAGAGPPEAIDEPGPDPLPGV